jgi:hypothetical protein
LTFQDAEKTYKDLRTQHAAGKLSDADFEAKVGELRMQDAQGRWWQLGVQTGEWYMHDGQKWNKAKPPMPSAAATSPGAAPEVGAQKSKRSSVLPARLFSAAPAGRAGGLPPAALIVIIAVVALVGLAILIGGYLFISGSLGGSSTARVTTTPTVSIAALASPVIPTITLAPPIATPLPPPTIAVTATEVVTATRAAAKPTATKKPVTPTPAGPTATATVNVPPGVYVTNVETIPAKANVGDMIGFKISFLNTTGSIQTYNWFVKVYQCPEQCQDFKHSYGETLHTNSNVATGTSAQSTSQTINLGTGIRCDLIAIVNYVDPVSQLPVPFQATQNNGYFAFTICH